MEPLTPEQIKNWRIAMCFSPLMTDAQIQEYRDEMQRRFDENTPLEKRYVPPPKVLKPKTAFAVAFDKIRGK